MGGNSRAVDRSTGEVKTYDGRLVFASPLSLRKVDEKKFRNDMVELLEELDQKSRSKYCRNIWQGAIFDVFLGSARQLFDHDDFSSVRDTIGDLDVAIPEESLDVVWDLLAGLENEEIIPGVRYLGQNRMKLRKPSINAVFSWGKHFVQIDFVELPFKDRKVDSFTQFSHSSPWEDLQKGLKGVAHKFFLQTLTWAVSHEENIVVLTDKSPLSPVNEIRFKKLHEPPRMMSFSVDKGLRARLVMQHGWFGTPLVIDGKTAYKELPTAESDYVTEPESIFMVLFGRRPDEMDMIDFQSFQGLLRLSRKYLPPKIVHMALDNMIRYKLYGVGQALSRDSIEIDRSIKERIIEVAKTAYPSFTEADCPIRSLQAKYYATYKERAVDE